MQQATSLLRIFIPLLMGFGVPMGIVPGDEDPLLMRIAPENVVAYASWAETQEADPDGNATEQWIAQEDMQRFWKDMDAALRRGAGEIFENADNPCVGHLNVLKAKLPKLISRQACGFYIDRVSPGEGNGFGGVMAINLGDRKDEIAEHLAKAREAIDECEEAKLVREHETDWIVVDESLFGFKIGMHKSYLVFGFATEEFEPDVESFFENKETPEPAWLTKLKERLPIPRRGAIGYINPEQLQKNSDFLSFMMGANKTFPTIGFVNGLDKDGYLGRTWVSETDIKDFEVLDSPIEDEFLAKLPTGKLSAVAASISKETIFELLKANAGDDEFFEESIAGFEAFSGLTLKDDLLNNLGNNVAVIGSPIELIMLGTGGFAKEYPLGLCFQIKDDMAFLDTIDGFARRLRELSKDDDQFSINTKTINDTEVYHVSLPSDGRAVREIYFCQYDSNLLVTLSSEVLESFISKEVERWSETKRIKELYQYAEEQDLGKPQLVFEVELKTDQIISNWEFISSAFKSMGFAKFPNVETMTKGLTPNVQAVFKTDDGTEIVHKGVMPSGNPVTFMAYAIVIWQMFNAKGGIFGNP